MREEAPATDDETANAADLLFLRGTANDALLYAALFLPRFVEIEGEVFLADLGVISRNGWSGVAGNVRRLRRKSQQALATYLDSCNWLELPYLFADTSCADETVAALAVRLVEAWDHRLSCLFPDRRFQTRVIDPVDTGSVIGIGFVRLA